MSFLPFVLSFLLILVLGSSVLFNSFRSSSLEKKVILGAHHAKIHLISDRAKTTFQKLKSETKKPEPPGKGSSKKKKKGYPDKRNRRNNLQTSKLNLWPLFEQNDKSLSDIVYQKSIALIEILYRDADFYKKEKDPGLAKKIVDAMQKQKGETLSDLFPTDSALASIYYKMLKGTNTGYPSLEEYFRLEKTDHPKPVIWSYASAPVLEAVLGKEALKRILEAEKASWEENHRKGTLTIEKLTSLLQNSHSGLDLNKLKTVFDFGKVTKGLPRAYVEESSKVMAISP